MIDKDPRTHVPKACEREPLHLSAQIQPVGVLLICEPKTLQVLQVSVNARQVLDKEPEALLGKSLPSLLGPGIHRCLSGVEPTERETRAFEPCTITLDDARGSQAHLVACAHRHDGLLMLELEAIDEGDGDGVADYHRLLRYINRLGRLGSESCLIRATVAFVREMTGYDRVMYYEFDADGKGFVREEALKQAGTHSYLAHRFPASDIPRQARQLYIRNPFRYIADTELVPVALSPEENPHTGRIPDMRYCWLRNVAEVHIQYLRNMGVRSSLSLPIVIEDELVALIACHSHAARPVGPWRRTMGQSVARILQTHLLRVRRDGAHIRRSDTRECMKQFLEQIIQGDKLLSAFSGSASGILRLFDAQVIVISMGEEQVLIPAGEARLRLTGELRRDLERNEVLADDKIEERVEWTDTGQAPLFSGAVMLDLEDGDFLCLGRREQIETVTWGGDPGQALPRQVDEATFLSPRTSFESWREQVRGRCAPFSVADMAAAHEMREILLRAKALEYRRLAEDKLRREAATDILTGLYNRREFFRRARAELKKARRHRRPLALLYFDLDH